MSQYITLCTDGRDKFVNANGFEPYPSRAYFEQLARDAAADCVRLSPGRADWSRWRVEVYHISGRREYSAPFSPRGLGQPTLRWRVANLARSLRAAVRGRVEAAIR